MHRQNKTPRVSRWTSWELLLLGVSVIMILFPALVTGYTLVSPTSTLAVDGPEQRITSTIPPSDFTPTASLTRTPIQTRTFTPTATIEPTVTSTSTQTATSEPSATGTSTATTDPAPTSEPSVVPTEEPSPTPAALAVSVRAVSTSGFPLPTVKVGESLFPIVKAGEAFAYYIEVTNDVTDALEIVLTDELPAEVASPRVRNVIGGTCSLDGQTLECELTPSEGQAATVVVEVTMGDIADGIDVTNTVIVRSPFTSEDDTGSVMVKVKGSVVATATATTESTATPTTTTEAGITATSLPPTATGESLPPTATGELPQPTVTEESLPTAAAGTSVPTTEATDTAEPTAIGTPVAEPRPPKPTSVPSRPDDPPESPDEPMPTNPPVLPITVVPVNGASTPTATPMDVPGIPVEPSMVVPMPSTDAPTATIPTSTSVPSAPTAPPAAVMPAPVDDVAPIDDVAPVGDAAPVVNRPVLTRGASGSDVSELQRMLNAWIAQTGITGVAALVVDGVFGDATEMAVRTFQAVAGLSVDGIVGPQTWVNLATFGGTNPPIVAPAPVAPVPVAPAPVAPAGSVPVVPPAAPAGSAPVVPLVTAPTDVVVQPALVQLAPTPTFAPTLVPVATPIGTAAPRSNVALRFNVASGTSEVSSGDLVMFTITLRHAGRGNGGSAPLPAEQLGRPGTGAELQGETIRDVMLVDELSPALELFAVNSVGMTVRRNGHRIEALRDQLAPGDAAVVVIGARVRDGINLPTIANQASLRYSSLSGAIYSNVTEIRVNGVQQPAPTASAASTPATTVTAVPSSTPAVAGAGGTQSTAAVPSATPIPSTTAPADLGTQLPTTSGGIPLGGIVLLGLTLLLHSLRVRHERSAQQQP